MKYLQRITIAMFLAMLLIYAGTKLYTATALDTTPPMIQYTDSLVEVSVQDPESALLRGITAVDNEDGDLSDQVMVTSVSQLITADTARVYYIVFDSSDNMATASRTVRYTDYEKPKFRLTKPLVYTMGDNVTLLDRLTATDRLDGNVSHNISVTSQNVDFYTPGVYDVTVQVSNSLGDFTSLPLKLVLNAEEELPEIRLKHYLLNLKEGDNFVPSYYLLGVYNAEGELIADATEVEITSPVDTSKPGSYNVRYTYTARGKTATIYLPVVVH